MAHAFSTDGIGAPAITWIASAADASVIRCHPRKAFVRCKINGNGNIRAGRSMARTAPDIAIVAYNTDYYLLNLITTLAPLHATGEIGAVHVWDNASTDRTADLLVALAATRSWLRVLRAPHNLHHGPALDQLLRHHCESEWALVLDSDTEVVRPFGAALAALDLDGAAFVGQIQPHVPELYAYLANLLVHRPRYLTLPPFRDHGAPGLDYFRAVDARRERFVRFRWCDYVHHFGQGSLRRLVERRERGNKFYAFACREDAAHPKPIDRIAREAALTRSLDRFLQASGGESAATATGAVTAVTRRSDRAKQQRDLREALRRARASVQRAIKTIRSPRTALQLRAARRLGLVQQRSEATALLAVLRSANPSCVLEIGTAYGGSLLLWARAATRNALIVSVDLPPWELDDQAEIDARQRIHNVGSAQQDVHLIRGDSHDARVLAQVRRLLDGRPADFLFIDGDHTYSGVARDFRDYSPLVRRGGIVAFHDIQPHSRGWGGGVPRFWREIREAHRHAELIASPDQDGFGIGLIWI
jgi:predicted O-methyltransferase YrrM